MTDWLEAILKLAVSREETSEEPLELPPEQRAYTGEAGWQQRALSAETNRQKRVYSVEKDRQQTAYAGEAGRQQAALSAVETHSPALQYGAGIRLLRALLRDVALTPDSVPEAILPQRDTSAVGADSPSDSDGTLSLLYRRVTESAGGIRPHGVSAGASGQEQVVVVRESASAPTGLTAEELDRAVRRDSRRYDGGMTIY